MCVYRNNEARSCSHFCCGQTMNITYSECVSVATALQLCACVVLLSFASLSLTYFPTLSHKRHDFRGGVGGEGGGGVNY